MQVSRIVRHIGSRKQLFVDEHVIAEIVNLSRNLHQVKKHPNNPILKSEQPWEFALERGASNPNVLYDADEKIFKMWYSTFQHTCYAISEDGLNWERPKLGLVEFRGSKENNIIDGRGIARHINGLLYCPEMRRMESPERLYKTLAWIGSGLGALFSPDGLRWTPYEENPVIPEGGDAGSIVKGYEGFPDYEENSASPRYIAFPKTLVKVGKFNRRCIGFSYSDVDLDPSKCFVEWSKPVLVLAPDEIDDEMAPERIAAAKDILQFDNPEDYHADFYAMSNFRYEGLYLGLLEIFDVAMDLKRIGAWNHHGPFEAQLVSSRDLVHWERVGDRKPIIPRGEPGAWDCGMVLRCSCVIVGDEIRIYYTGQPVAHFSKWNLDQNFAQAEIEQIKIGKRPQHASIGLATLRLDGFVSVDAGDQEGVLTTRPLTFVGQEFTINAQAESGIIAVEILNEDGRPIDGFGRDACDAFTGDNVHHTVTWQGNSDVSILQEKPIRLRFYMRNAELYAFKFSG